jgi:50S ribosomal protein L16 3-hydroxylase
MNNPLQILGQRDAQTFLDEFWQKQPCLIRGAVPDFIDPLTPQELAGLACEEDIQSRLVLEKHGQTPWEVRHGPFSEADFTSLPDTHWTLLVQDMNQHIPELALLLDQFSFIPSWRLDDVMVSYASPAGSVGPHTDQYDVFLLQGMGQRRWQISHQKDQQNIEGLELSILREFKAEQTWTLEAGDILYLPPGVAHYGVAETDCLTYSIGFRAPLEVDLLSSWADHLVLQDSSQLRYRDPDLQTPLHPGKLDQLTINYFLQRMADLTQQPDEFRAWLAEHFTLPAEDVDLRPEQPHTTDELLAMIQAGTPLLRSEYCRFAYIDNNDASIEIYINGRGTSLRETEAELGKLICDQRQFHASDLERFLDNVACTKRITDWFNEGYLYFISMMNDPDYQITVCHWRDEEPDIKRIRETVFIQEQCVPEALEWDDKDIHCTHILVRTSGGIPIATARMTADGHIGRMAVLAEYRLQGIGSAVLRHLLAKATHNGLSRVQLDAQTYAIPFYEKHGFKAYGEEFMDAGIPHRHMEKIL